MTSTSPPGPRDKIATLTEDTLDEGPRSHPFAIADRGILTQTGGLEAGRVCSLGMAGATLGRASSCTHAFDDGGLSRVHARVSREGDVFLFEDAGSSNGSYVNDARVQKVMLQEGDRIRMGSTTLRFQRVSADEEAALRRVYESSVKDGLTGAVNRKHLEERLAAEFAFAQRHRTPLSLVLFDLDHFKRVNDRFGHLAGDEVLRRTAAVFREGLRAEDLLARYGGEELVVVARGVKLDGAVQMANRLRRAVAAAEMRYESHVIRVTVSGGVASLACLTEATTTALLALADERLYKAKEQGRDCVVADTK